MTQVPPKSRGLKNRLWENALKTPPSVAFKILFIWFLLSPWFLVSLLLSSLKARRLSRLQKCREFIRSRPAAFPEIDPDSLSAESLSGGVSNSNRLWHCKTFDGKAVTYFVKVFVPVGTFWAHNLSLVSPFPKTEWKTSRERFNADLTSRAFFAEHGISIPRLIATDAGEQMLVTEYLEGGNVDSLLKKTGKEYVLNAGTEKIIAECGMTLGKIHGTGYSLVDTQPINCICTADGKVHFTDLEFCTRQNQKTWDVGFFLCFLSIRLSGEIKTRASKLFLEAYAKEAELPAPADLEKVKARLKDYIPTFKTILEVRKFKPEELFDEIVSPI